MSLIFKKIIPENNQIDSLYELLLKRKNVISHKKVPSYKEHSEFVLKNPYLEWYLLYKKNHIIVF